MEGRCDKWEVRGKYDTIVEAKIEQQRKKKKKYTMALNGHRPINNHTTTNQIKVSATESGVWNE